MYSRFGGGRAFGVGNHHDRASRLAQNPAGGGADEDIVHRAVAVRSEEDEIDALLVGDFENRFDRSALANLLRDLDAFFTERGGVVIESFLGTLFFHADLVGNFGIAESVCGHDDRRSEDVEEKQASAERLGQSGGLVEQAGRDIGEIDGNKNGFHR